MVLQGCELRKTCLDYFIMPQTELLDNEPKVINFQWNFRGTIYKIYIKLENKNRKRLLSNLFQDPVMLKHWKKYVSGYKMQVLMRAKELKEYLF